MSKPVVSRVKSFKAQDLEVVADLLQSALTTLREDCS